MSWFRSFKNVRSPETYANSGAHGIGFGIASNLASQGATVVIADINGERGQEAVEKLEKLQVLFHLPEDYQADLVLCRHPGVKVNFQTCDVSSCKCSSCCMMPWLILAVGASQVAAFAGARKFSGQDRIDVVFANAGML